MSDHRQKNPGTSNPDKSVKSQRDGVREANVAHDGDSHQHGANHGQNQGNRDRGQDGGNKR